MEQYRIQSGDTLSGIAKQYNTTVDRLAKINNIKNVDKIKAGSVLKLNTTNKTNTVSKPTVAVNQIIDTEVNKSLFDINAPQYIIKYEGTKLNDQGQHRAYYATEKEREKNILTVGIGHQVVAGDLDIHGNPITKEHQVVSDEQVATWFKKDYNSAKNSMSKLPSWNTMGEPRQVAFVNLAFNMGNNWMAEFEDATECLNRINITTNPIHLKELWVEFSEHIALKKRGKLNEDGTLDLTPSKYVTDVKEERSSDIINILKTGRL